MENIHETKDLGQISLNYQNSSAILGHPNLVQIKPMKTDYWPSELTKTLFKD